MKLGPMFESWQREEAVPSAAVSINLDSRGEIVSELSARVVRGEDGKPRLEPYPGTVARWLAVLGRHADKGSLRLAISRVSQRRSSGQNRLLWGVVYPQILEGLREMALEAGEACPFRDVEDLHEALKHRFLGASVVRVGSEEMEVPPTTTNLNLEQFGVYIRNVTEWAAAHKIYVEMQESA